MDHLPWQTLELNQPIEPQLPEVLKPTQKVLPTWREHLQQSHPRSPRQLSQESATLPTPQPVDMLQPVAQWVSPVNPEVVIQIWCTPRAVEPVCFTSQGNLAAPAQQSKAPL